MNKHKHIFKIT